MKRSVRLVVFLACLALVSWLAISQGPGGSLGERVSRGFAKVSHHLLAWRNQAVDGQRTPSFATVAASAGPAVVNVTAKQKVPLPPSLAPSPGLPEGGEGGEEDLPESLDPGALVTQRRSTGTGFLVRGDGTIVTSSDVVHDAQEVTVRFAKDPKQHSARVIGVDPPTSLALLKVSDVGDAPSLSFAAPGKTRVGDWVLGIGNPFGLDQTLTAGIVSATRPAGPVSADFLQVNASMNPGDSGGPLLNLDGEVVGINSAVFREGESNVGIAFALSGEAGAPVVEQLATRGRVVRPWLGVTVQEVTPDLARSLDFRETAGALVSDVQAGSPADKAGVKRGDVIVAFAGEAVRSLGDLTRRVATSNVGTRADLEVLRAAASRQKLPVTLEEMSKPPKGDAFSSDRMASTV